MMNNQKNRLIRLTTTYDYYGMDGGTPYSGGNGYSSGAGYSSTSVASRGGYYLYVPQSAYYSKEAQLVAEEGERAEKADEGGFN
ncbi:hypothetical protein, partial [Lactococcus lactis]